MFWEMLCDVKSMHATFVYKKIYLKRFNLINIILRTFLTSPMLTFYTD